jgi:hypothetical protein
VVIQVVVSLAYANITLASRPNLHVYDGAPKTTTSVVPSHSIRCYKKYIGVLGGEIINAIDLAGDMKMTRALTKAARMHIVC